MKLNTFLKQYDKITDDNERVEFLKKHLKRKYVPFIERNNAVRRTVEATHVINGKYEQNTQLLEMFKDLDFIELFTDIEFNRIVDGNAVSADIYDELMSRGIIDGFKALLTFDQRDVWESTYYDTIDDLKNRMTSQYALAIDIIKRIGDVLNEINNQIELGLLNINATNQIDSASEDVK